MPGGGDMCVGGRFHPHLVEGCRAVSAAFQYGRRKRGQFLVDDDDDCQISRSDSRLKGLGVLRYAGPAVSPFLTLSHKSLRLFCFRNRPWESVQCPPTAASWCKHCLAHESLHF